MKIRDAASIVLLDRRTDTPKVLMGRRASKHVFMPDVYVFPGGRVDYGDRFTPFAHDYHPDTLDLVLQKMRGRPSALRARMMGLAAIRETQEEVGLLLGQPAKAPRHYETKPWAAFGAADLLPDLSKLQLLARAITPPGQKRRFDTRFFISDISDDLEDQSVQSSEELEDVQWISLDDPGDLPLHFITKRILLATREAVQHLSNGKTTLPVPFYRPVLRAGEPSKRMSILEAGKEPRDSGEVPADIVL